MRLVFIITAFSFSAYAQPNCYNMGLGPIQTCMESGTPIQVRRSFTYTDGHRYSWNHQMKTYCFLNEYGNPHCIQNTLIKHLQCDEQKGVLKCN